MLKFIRVKIRQLILSFAGIFVFLLSIRIVLNLLGNNVNTENSLIKFLYSLSSFLMDPFEGSTDSLSREIGFDLDPVLAIFVILIVALIIAELINSIFHLNPVEIIKNIVDAFFKILEFLLFTRIIFDLFSLSSTTWFGELIYRYTNWADNVFINTRIIDGKVSLSILIVLFFVVILDLITEGLLDSIFNVPEEDREVKSEIKYVQNSNPQYVQTRQDPVQQTINIHVPPQQQVPNQTIFIPQGMQQRPYQQIPVQNRFQVPVQTLTVKKKGFMDRIRDFFGQEGLK